MGKYCLGTIEASEQLIKDLYINLRNEVNAWSKVTYQTPQARMGYIGQHLVSVVTGYKGGKSGARGYDLIINSNEFAEIKTCYRVDQLGECANCKNAVSSLEKECSNCGSTNIIRKDDSKWLIGIEHDQEFAEIIMPKAYYFVLFEFEDLNNIDNRSIIATIWEVNAKNKGFAYCMIDYYLNIKSNSSSGAPFNMWPYKLKFALCNPKLIYKSIIEENDTIKTIIFPTMKNTYIDELKPLEEYSNAKTLTLSHVKNILKTYGIAVNDAKNNKKQLLGILQNIREQYSISNYEMCEILSDTIYLPLIQWQKDKILSSITQYFETLQ